MSFDISTYESKMEKSLSNMREEFMSIRAGRANPHVLDKIQVDYYGTPTPIQGVANVSVPEARIIQIAPWDNSLMKDIEKAIIASDIGLTPANDGKVIRLVFPELTEDRRKELAKDVKKKGEDTKVAVRNIRRDANEAVKKSSKANEISEDEAKDAEADIQKLTDRFIADVDKAVQNKTDEIMTV
ncbi:MAG: ribosome recycling factor [Eubacterium sp.]|nr:ribosome recycling factor [Eubacterium sp.]